VENKLCTVCGEVKSINNFTKIKGTNRYKYICHKCRSNKYKENPKPAIDRAKQYYLNNKEKVLISRRIRYQDNYRQVLWSSAKERAIKKGVPFDIEVDDIEIPETCPVLGIPLQHGKGRPIAGSPTLDRIIPEIGYVRGNIMVISHKANTIKSDATPEELRKVAAFYEKLLRV